MREVDNFYSDIKDSSYDWNDFSSFFMSMREDFNKEASLKEFGKNVGLGAGISASIGAIRATDKREGEGITDRVKRIASDSASSAVDGAIQGTAVHAIKNFSALRDATKRVKIANFANVVEGTAQNVAHFGRNQYNTIRQAAKPHSDNLVDHIAKGIAKKPSVSGAIAGGIGGAGVGDYIGDSTGATMTGAALGALGGAKYGPALKRSIVDKHNPLLGEMIANKVRTKLALNMAGAAKTVGNVLGSKGIGGRLALGGATAAGGAAIAGATGGDKATGAAAGLGAGLLGRSAILGRLAKPNGILGKGVARGIRQTMNGTVKNTARAAGNVAADVEKATATVVPNVASTASNIAPVSRQLAATSTIPREAGRARGMNFTKMDATSRPTVKPGTPAGNAGPVANATNVPTTKVNPATNAATPPTMQPTTVPKTTPVEPNLSELAAQRGVTAPNPRGPGVSGKSLEELRVPESTNFTGNEISSLNLTGTPKPSILQGVGQKAQGMAQGAAQAITQPISRGVNAVGQRIDNVRQGVGNSMAARASKKMWSDPKTQRLVSMVESTQGNPQALAGMVNNLSEAEVQKLVSMGLI